MTNLVDTIIATNGDPAAIMEVACDAVETVLGGDYDVPDPSNPFVFLLEMAAIKAGAAMTYDNILSRRQYVQLATTDTELYHHLSDANFADRFCTPSTCGFYFLLSKDEVYTRSILMSDGVTRKLTIPRNTEIVIDGLTYSLEYPIDIKIAAHGGLQLVYDTNVESPLHSLGTNVVNWDVVSLYGVECLRIYTTLRQFKIETHYESVSAALGCVNTYSYTDSFYYCRVYTQLTTGVWTELNTTHSDQVFNPSKPTALLTVTAGKVRVYIPQVYIDKGLVNPNQLRVDVYQSRGPVTMNLLDYGADSFTINWKNIDNDNSAYVAPLSLFNIAKAYSDETTTGGSSELDFDTLKQRVIDGAYGNYDSPVTEAQLEARLSDYGFDIKKIIDNVTNRQYLATRDMPVPTTLKKSSAASACVATLRTTYNKLSVLRNVESNGTRVTIKPDQLYLYENGVLDPVSNYELDRIANLGHEAFITEMNSRSYVWSPFYYVLDNADNTFDVRPYHLDKPAVLSKLFIADSDTANIEVTVGAHSITKTNTGYSLYIVTKSGDTFKALSPADVVLQLAFLPNNEIDYAYINAVYMGTNDEDEWVFRFDLTTNHDILNESNADYLYLTNFKMYDDEQRRLGAPLTTKFDLLFVVNGLDTSVVTKSAIDDRVGSNWVPSGSRGVVWERLEVKLGVSLKWLWASARSVASSITYKTYPTDVPYTYPEDVYERDPVTQNIALVIDGNGNITYKNKLHSKGDPVLVDGSPTYKHYAGEVYYDQFNNPVPEDTRKIEHQMDIFMLDALYKVATDDLTVTYRDSLIEETVSWITNILNYWSGKMIDQTVIWFKPKATAGYIDVIVGSNVKKAIPASQAFTVNHYIKEGSSADTRDDVKDAIRTSTRQAILEVLAKSVISISDINDRLKRAVGDEVIGFDVSYFGPNNDISTLTIEDDTSRMSIKKKLSLQADNKFGVVDDVNINFIVHKQD